MARIPIYERQVGTPNINIASGMADGSAAAPFAALRQFGDALGMIGQVIEREREDTAQAWVSSTVAKAQVDWAQRFRDAQETAAENPEDFTPRLMKEYQDWKQALVQQAPTPRSRQVLDSQLNSYGAQLGVRAITFQEGAQAAYRTRLTVNEIQDRSKVVTADPMQYDQQRTEFEEGLNNRGIAPAQRAKLRDDGRRVLAYSTAQGVIERDPVGFIRDFMPNTFRRRYGESAPTLAAPPGQPAVELDSVYNALLLQESGGVHLEKDGRLRTSPKGATGISQLMPATRGPNPGFGVRPLQNESEEEYRRVGREYLQAMYREFAGDMTKALAAYNAGHQTVKNAIIAARKEGDESKWLSKLPRETQNYVPSVLRRINVVRGGSESDFYMTGGQDQFDPNAPLEQIPNGPSWWKDLPVEDQTRLAKAAITTANQKLVGGKTDLQERRKDLHASLLSTGEGNEIPKAEYERIFPPAIAERYYMEDRAVRDLGRFGKTVAGMTEAEQMGALGAPPPPGQPAHVYEMYQRKAKLVQDARTARDRDPSGYVATASPIVRNSLSAMMTAQQAAQDNPTAESIAAVDTATRSYVANSLAEQRRLGVREPVILSEAQADAVAQSINAPGTQGESAATRMQRLSQQYGRFWPQVLGELSKKNKLNDMGLVLSAGTGSTASAAKLAEANQVGEKGLKDIVGDTAVKGLDDAVAKSMRTFSQTLAPLSGGGARTEMAYQRQARLLAMMYMRDGESMKSAVDKAFNDLVSYRYTFNGTYRIPKQYTAPEVSRGANLARINITADMMPDIPGVSDPAYRKEQQAAAVRNSGYWVTTADPEGRNAEAGLTLYVGGAAVLNASGKPIFLSFEELQRQGQRPTAEPLTTQAMTAAQQEALTRNDMRELERLRATERRQSTQAFESQQRARVQEFRASRQ
jgi:hypothetical protein